MTRTRFRMKIKLHSMINNERMLRLVRQHSKRIGAFMWIKPRLESCDQDFEDMIASNRDIIYGIKVHPYHSKMAFNSDKVQEYIRLAQKYDLPVVSHTSNDYESSHSWFMRWHLNIQM